MLYRRLVGSQSRQQKILIQLQLSLCVKFCLLRHALGCLIVSIIPTAAAVLIVNGISDYYDPSCAIDIVDEAYMSGWEHDYCASKGSIDVVVAAQVARNVYKAFTNAKVDCQDTFGNFKSCRVRCTALFR